MYNGILFETKHIKLCKLIENFESLVSLAGVRSDQFKQRPRINCVTSFERGALHLADLSKILKFGVKD